MHKSKKSHSCSACIPYLQNNCSTFELLTMLFVFIKTEIDKYVPAFLVPPTFFTKDSVGLYPQQRKRSPTFSASMSPSRPSQKSYKSNTSRTSEREQIFPSIFQITLNTINQTKPISISNKHLYKSVIKSLILPRLSG